MPKVIYIKADGTHCAVEVPAGTTVMQGAMSNNIEGIVAECGGACACGTCHCYIDDVWSEKAGEAGEFERAMLECLNNVTPNSRLSCQITVTEELNGLIVRLPESQY